MNLAYSRSQLRPGLAMAVTSSRLSMRKTESANAASAQRRKLRPFVNRNGVMVREVEAESACEPELSQLEEEVTDTRVFELPKPAAMDR